MAKLSTAVAATAVGVAVWSATRGPEDEIGQICSRVAWYQDTTDAFARATYPTVRAFEEICREEFPKMPDDVRHQIGGLLKIGKLEWALVNRWKTMARWGRPTSPETCARDRRQKTPEEVKRDIWPRHGQAEYLKAGVHPLQERRISSLEEIKDVWAKDEVAVFDGRKLLPKRMFNVTMQDIANAESKEDADAVSVFMNRGYIDFPTCYSWLVYLTTEVPKWGVRSWKAWFAKTFIIPYLLTFSCPKPGNSLNEVGSWVKGFVKHELPFNHVGAQSTKLLNDVQKLKAKRQDVGSGQTNSWRVPKWKEGVDYAKALGITNLIEHAYSILWIGTTAGEFHDDFQDNVLVQVSGYSSMIVFPSNCSPLIKPVYGPKRKIPENTGALEWGTKGVPKGKVKAPFYHVSLKPGDGMVVPSGAIHKVVTGDPRRLALNAFFEPKFGEMQWPGSPLNIYNTHTKEGLAVRVLWLRVIHQLWIKRKIAMSMHTERLELL